MLRLFLNQLNFTKVSDYYRTECQ